MVVLLLKAILGIGKWLPTADGLVASSGTGWILVGSKRGAFYHVVQLVKRGEMMAVSYEDGVRKEGGERVPNPMTMGSSIKGFGGGCRP